MFILRTSFVAPRCAHDFPSDVNLQWYSEVNSQSFVSWLRLSRGSQACCKGYIRTSASETESLAQWRINPRDAHLQLSAIECRGRSSTLRFSRWGQRSVNHDLWMFFSSFRLCYLIFFRFFPKCIGAKSYMFWNIIINNRNKILKHHQICKKQFSSNCSSDNHALNFADCYKG